jgi:hypothetical protein
LFGKKRHKNGIRHRFLPDLAIANAVALPSNQPGGFNPIPEPAMLSLVGLGGAVMLRRGSV